MCCVESQMDHLNTVDTKELGEAIDMLKDLEEAIYYATITKAMNEPTGEKANWHNTHDVMYYTEPYFPEDRKSTDNWEWHKKEDSYAIGTRETHETEKEHEGRAGKVRRSYMEGKMKHHDAAAQMKELEKYMKELSDDILEMIEEATPEERQFLGKKIATLATKVEAVD